MSVLKVENLKFKYPSADRYLLSIANLEVKKGEKVFIQGASGSGKTTLLNILAGVLPLSQGSLKILDQDMNGLSNAARDNFRGDHMGFIFQLFNLLPFLSVAENILLPLEFSQVKKKKVGDSKKAVQNLMAHLELDEEYFSKKVTELSVGQQQRVAVARALIGAPEILIADEPTSSLDQDLRDKFIQLMLKEANNNQTSVLFVSHDRTLEKHFDRVISIKEMQA